MPFTRVETINYMDLQISRKAGNAHLHHTLLLQQTLSSMRIMVETVLDCLLGQEEHWKLYSSNIYTIKRRLPRNRSARLFSCDFIIWSLFYGSIFGSKYKVPLRII